METGFEKDLRNHVQGDVYFDSTHRKIYSVDASIYEIEPLGIVMPKSKEDIVTAINIAGKYGVPVIARGAATGITGGCLGKGLIIDHSRYFNNIEAVNFHDRFAICQPGVVQDSLNKILAVRNFRLGPETSTGDRATLGGMMANNSAGARSLYYGKMVDHVIGIELILASGEVIYFKEVDDHTLKEKLNLTSREGHIYREVCRIREQYREEIQQHFPQISRRVSGYNLDELLKSGPLNICKLITGSEGTLGIAGQIKVNLMEMPQYVGLSLIFFHSLQESLKHIASIMERQPISLELIDDQIISRGRESPTMRNKLEWLRGSPKALLVVEFQAHSENELKDKLQGFNSNMQQKNIGYERCSIMDEKQMKHVWDLRKSGLGLLLSKRSYSRALAFIEDISIDPRKLPDFMEKFQIYLNSIGKEAGIYGHVGAGCMHVRPYIDLRSSDEQILMKKILEDVSSLVLEYGGALSGEHGDGIVRTWLNEKMFGKKIYQAFKELKAAFDPSNLMNPGKIVDGQPFLDHLRFSPSTSIGKIDTFLDFSAEGGFELAVDLCNGNGLCRKNEGVMCPSFQATDNEYDSTRARAQALRSIIHSSSPLEKLTEQGLYDVLDLCLQCKGCKTECPSQVDMAKMKTEFMYHYQKKHGISLSNRLFGHLSKWIAVGSRFPRFANFLTSNSLSKAMLNFMGITTKRPLPKLSKKCFSHLIKSLKKEPSYKGKVVLFNDTFTEFISPEIGVAAFHILQKLGYEVIIPSWTCCGRPLITKGFLPEARKQALQLIHTLLPYALEGLPIIGLEPSCLLTIVDDYASLIPKEKLSSILENAVTFDTFLNKHIVNGELPLKFKPAPGSVKYHIHCYQKALIGSKPTENLLKAIPRCESSEIKSGCCGMAGSFGYEKAHYDISMRIANLYLFPAIKYSAKHSKIIANGFSCRSQIHQGTQVKAIHLAEFLADILEL